MKNPSVSVKTQRANSHRGTTSYLPPRQERPPDTFISFALYRAPPAFLLPKGFQSAAPEGISERGFRPPLTCRRLSERMDLLPTGSPSSHGYRSMKTVLRQDTEQRKNKQMLNNQRTYLFRHASERAGSSDEGTSAVSVLSDWRACLRSQSLEPLHGVRSARKTVQWTVFSGERAEAPGSTSASGPRMECPGSERRNSYKRFR